MNWILGAAQKLALSFIATVTILFLLVFIPQAWFVAVIAYLVLQLLFSVIGLTVSATVNVAIMFILLWIGVSIGVSRGIINSPNQAEKPKRVLRLSDDGELQETD